MKYRIDSGKVMVQARSRIHDTNTVWTKVTGTVEADASALDERSEAMGGGGHAGSAGGAGGQAPRGIEQARATFAVDMTSFDAGDWLKNRKLKKDFDMDAHPQATFELRAVRDVVRDGARFTATADGVLRWRGKEVALTLAGQGTLDDTRVEASATFELDIRKLGLAAPRVLMIKMEDEVTVDVSVRGTVVA